MNNYLMACFAVGVIVCSLKAGSPPMPTAPPAREAPAPPNEPLRWQKSFTITTNHASTIPDEGKGISAVMQGPFPELQYLAGISYSYVGRLHYVAPKKNEYPSKIPPAGPSALYLPKNVDRGAIFPVIGFLYKVEFNDGEKLSMTWIPDKELPKGLKPVQRDSLFLPSEGKTSFWHRDDRIGMTTLPGGSISTIKFEERENNEIKRLVATLKYEDYGKKSELVEVREGDVLVLPIEGAFVVRFIVMPDKKTKVVGWVELSSKPIPEADLEKEKRTIVRIKRPK